MLFNINDEIQVKLNDKGREIYLHAFDDDVPERVSLPEEDAEGYSKFQMWVFMQIFGPHINMGFAQPFDTTIKFNPKERTSMSDHTTVRVEELDADIDEQIVDLVLQFNGSGGRTVSSCQGDPGIIGEGGRYGHVAFLAPANSYMFMAYTVFGALFNLTKDMYDDVRVEMTASPDLGFMGWVYFRNEAIPELLRVAYRARREGYLTNWH